MNSTKNWVSFDDEEMNSQTGRSSVSSLDNLDSLSSGSLDQLNCSFQDSGARYSVFDVVRQRERNGEYLGWSSDILGEGETGWSEGLRRTSL